MKKILTFFAFVTAFPCLGISQQIYSGQVTDSVTGAPLSSASITLLSTGKGAISDSLGQFSIEGKAGDQLSVSSIGYSGTTLRLGDQSHLLIRLSPSAGTLDEVVIIGYGTARRSQVVGSVAQVDGEEIAARPVLSAAQGIQGKVPGVQITASGAPGSQPQVRVRGVGSVLGNANPIYVVDGVITDDITNINNNDIASVQVLKDASAQAIYGSRAGNGVVIVTTKSGRSGKMRISLNAYTGFKTPTSKVALADARTYAAFTNAARTYDNKPLAFDLDTIGATTNWFDKITRKGLIQNYELNVSGGSEKVTYYFGGSVFKDQGIIPGEDYTRAAFRINNEYRLAPFFKLGHNLNVSAYNMNNKPTEFDDAYRMAPTVPVRFANGNYGFTDLLNVGNPVAKLDLTHDRSKQLRLQGNVFAELTPVNGLTLRSSYNFDYHNNNQKIYVPVYNIWSGMKNDVSNLTQNNDNSFYYIIDNNATYNKTFNGVHEINATIGYSSEKVRDNSWMGTIQNVPADPNLWYLDQGDNNADVHSSGAILTRASAYSRLIYTYDRRYIFNGSLRRDGSSSFPTENQYGTFYSIGGAWVVSEEKFMENQHLFNSLKLRAGYGKVGNDITIANLRILNEISLQKKYYGFGGPDDPAQQAWTFDQIKDAAVSWETTTGTDLGLEFSMLQNKLSGDVSYYNKLTHAFIPVTVPTTYGDADKTVYSQAADVRNKGIEFDLNWKDHINKDFSYHLGFNMTFNKNVVDHVDGSLQLKGGSLGNGEIVTYTVEGQPIGSFWVLQTDGIYKSQDQIDGSAHIEGTQPGDFRYVDQNGDGLINDNDRIFAGSYQPKFYYGVNGGLNWKGLDFSFDLYGNNGNKIYNGKKAVRFGNEQIEASRARDMWSADNPDGTQPRASNAVPKPSTYFVESGNFLRVNNITLGYTVPHTERWHIKSLRVFASADNPVIWKKYSGYTPELPGNALSSGIELSIYPVTATYLLGVNIGL
ncbi:SusC/RagA family TonB-linked outer membrane protein [Arachidicoccus terrestris]|uniref:SusC/RagA family TonB-linked outer membrane protein n=1 Tax=Arachidicoccus terrestris TaxID=2875539 RepID=UPI001CC5340D|nr:TonB-dependent receptor [Arachidicoccus terrestris]UAY55161.1 TonB-dependent receptor [Arachidicoccus terrestris]